MINREPIQTLPVCCEPKFSRLFPLFGQILALVRIPRFGREFVMIFQGLSYSTAKMVSDLDSTLVSKKAGVSINEFGRK